MHTLREGVTCTQQLEEELVRGEKNRSKVCLYRKFRGTRGNGNSISVVQLIACGQWCSPWLRALALTFFVLFFQFSLIIQSPLLDSNLSHQ